MGGLPANVSVINNVQIINNNSYRIIQGNHNHMEGNRVYDKTNNQISSSQNS